MTYAIFITGTAGSGKSLLASRLVPWYAEKESYAISVNLDPGAANLPYTPDVDIRDYVDIQTIMNSYQLGPNGALIFAADLIATKLQELEEEICSLNPDMAIIDTPGQVELFSYRSSGPFLVQNLTCDGRAVVFLFDSTLVSTPSNFVSVALLATSIQIRLGAPQVAVLSKRDLVGERWREVMAWSSKSSLLEEAIRREADDTGYLLSTGILHQLVKGGLSYELIPVSSVTQEGLVELSATLARVLRGGEEAEY